MAFMGPTGFSIVAWVKEESPLLSNLSEEASTQMQRQLLNDFCCLLGMRWNMDMHVTDAKTHNGILYAFGTNNRITVSDRTIRNAIGELAQHIDFLRGQAKTSPGELINYRQCRLKWKVPDVVTDSSYGAEDTDSQGTFHQNKRRRT